MSVCVACRSSSVAPLAQPVQAEERPRRAEVCADCGVVHLYDVAAEADAGTVRDGFRHLTVKEARKRGAEAVVDAVVRLARTWVVKDRAPQVMELGSRGGAILVAAAAAGLKAVGSSAAPAVVETAEGMGLEMRLLGPEVEESDEGAYDVVVSIDHLLFSATPGDDLADAFTWLRPGGLLYVKAGVCDDPAAPEHVSPRQTTVFSLDGLKAMIAAAGFEVLRDRPGTRATVIARRPTPKSSKARPRVGFRWETVETCNHCGSSERTLYMESDVPPWYEGRPLRLEQCSGCGLVYASPRPLAEDLYVGYMSANDKAEELFFRKRARAGILEGHGKIIDEAAAYLDRAPKTLFDMGCGAGTILLAARERGIEAEGNDVNRFSIDHLKGEGFNAHFGFTDQVDLPEGRFDIVTNLDYLEHTYQPMDDLHRCARMLAPGGVLYLKTLYLDCPRHKEMGPGWNLFGPGHFHFFPAETLRAMVLDAGLEIVKVKTVGLITIIARKTAQA